MSHQFNISVISEMADTVQFLSDDFQKSGPELIVEFLDVYESFGFPVVGVA